MFLLPIKLDWVSFETKGRQNLQKTADFLIESIVFCPLVPPSWISLVDPTSAMYASAIYVSYIYARDHQLSQKLSCAQNRDYNRSLIPVYDMAPFLHCACVRSAIFLASKTAASK